MTGMTADATLRFVAREGFHLSDEDAQVIVNEFERLYEENGPVTAESLLEAAKPTKSPLHRFFEWNDGEAAHRYRLQQAGYLVRSVAIVEVESRRAGRTTESVMVQRKAIISADEEDGGHSFHPRAVILSDADKHQRHIANLWRRIYGYRDEIADFAEFDEFVKDMDRQHKRMTQGQLG